ncbi:mucin-binding protein, partial [Streptococcus suis]
MFRKGKHIDTRQRFTIKKFKIGAASVLIGTVFAGFGTHVQADELTVNEPTVTTLSPTEEVSPEVEDAESATPVAAEGLVSEFTVETVNEEKKEETVASQKEETSEVSKEEAEKDTVEVPVIVDVAAVETTEGTSNKIGRPTNEGQPLNQGTGFRTTTELQGHPGYSVTTATFPDEYKKFYDPAEGRFSFSLVKLTQPGFTNYLTLSTDESGKAYLTEFRETGDLLKTAELTTAIDKFGGININDIKYNGKVEAKLLKTSAELTMNPAASALKLLVNQGIPDGKGVDSTQVILRIPKIATQTTEHLILDTGARLDNDVKQSTYEGAQYTTKQIDTSEYDVIIPFNADGTLSKRGHLGPGSVQSTTSTFTKDNAGGTVKVGYKVEHQEDGSAHVKVSYDGVPQQPLVEAGRSITVYGREYPVFKPSELDYAVVRPTTSAEGPYRAFFPSYFDADKVKISDDYHRSQGNLKEGETITPAYHRVNFTVKSDVVRYFYTREKAEVVFRDITDEKNPVILTDHLESETDKIISYGKGETAVTKDIVNAQSGKNIDTIIETYKETLDFVKDGFNEAPKLNIAQGTGVEGEKAKINLATPLDKLKSDEIARQEANKKVIYIDFRRKPEAPKQEADLKFYTVDADGTSNKTLVENATFEATGPDGTAINFPDYAAKLQALKDKGYVVQSDNYNGAAEFDTDSSEKQHFEVIVKPKITDQVEEKTITRIVTYVKRDTVDGPDRETVAAPEAISVTYTRTGKYNHVTKEVDWSASVWTAKNGDQVLEGRPLENVPGYQPVKAERVVGGQAQTGITPQSTVDNINTTDASENIVEKVIYTPIPNEVARIEFKQVPKKADKDDVSKESVIDGYDPLDASGQPGTVITFAELEAKKTELEAAGYEILKDTFEEANVSDKNFDNDPNTPQVFKVVVTPKITPITPDEPGKPGEPIDPKNPGPKWPNDKGVDDVEREIRRTITYVTQDADGTNEQEYGKKHSTSVTYVRTGEINHVTGEVTWKPWVASGDDKTLDGNPLPIIEGYAVQPKAERTVTGSDKIEVDTALTTQGIETTEDSKDVVEKVIYRPIPPKQQLAKVTYIDETDNNKLLETSPNSNGLATEPITPEDVKNDTAHDVLATIKYYEERGYEVKSNNFDEKPTYDDVDGNVQDIPIILVHKEITIPPTDPKKPTDPIYPDPNTPTNPIPDSPNYPSGVGEKDLNKTATRTIYYKYLTQNGDEAFAAVNQTVKFARSAVIDSVTGELKRYTPWEVVKPEGAVEAVSGFTQRISPSKADYTVDRPSVDRQLLDPDKVVDGYHVDEYVIYTPVQKQNARVIFKEVPSREDLTESDITSSPEAIKAAQVQSTTGNTNKTIKFPNLEAAKAELEKLGYEVVSDNFTEGTTKKFDNDANVDQEFKVLVTPRYEDIPPKDTPNWPEGTPEKDKQEKLVERVTRTIHYRYLTPDGAEASKDVVETLEFERSARINMVTKEVTYTEWTPKTTTTFTNVTSPIIEGFTADKLEAGEFTNIKATDDDKEVTVVYTPKSPEIREEQEAKTITRTINYWIEKENGEKAFDSVIQTITFNRTAYVDQSTGAKTYSNWSTDSFKGVDSPSLEKHTVDRNAIPELAFDNQDVINNLADGQKFVENVIYTPKPEEVTETKKITRTINYWKIEKNFETTPAAASVTKEVEYTRTGTKDPNTGQVTWGEWTPVTDGVLAGNPMPEVDGYKYQSTHKTQGATQNVPQSEASTTEPIQTAHDDANIVETVYFVPTEPDTPTPPPAPETPKQGDVIVKYVKEGTTEEIANQVADENNKPYETAYNTSDNRPNEIVGKDGKTYVFVKRSGDSAPEEGTITEPLTTVVYEYKEKAKGNVVVNYRIQGDENTPIQPPVNDTTDAYVGTDYNTSEHKTPTIQYNGKIYELVPDQQTPNESGQVTEGTTNVTYYYREVPPTPKQQSVIIFEDGTNNKELTRTGVVEGDTGTPISPETATPVADNTAKTIEYYEARGYKVTTNGFDSNPVYDEVEGNVQEVKIVLVHDEIPVTPEDPKDPTDPIHPDVPEVPGEEKPKYPEGVSEKDLKKTVTRTIHYWIERENGEKAFETRTETVTFKRTAYIDSVTGEFKRYSDWSVGKFDEVESPTKDGYTVDRPLVGEKSFLSQDEINALPNGKEFVEHVIYTPKTPEAPKTGTVVIEYVDTKGNPIKTSVVDDKDVPVGTDYDTTDEDGKPST